MQFSDLIKTKKFVLVKFGADWCAPCKRIQPILESIAEQWEHTGLELWAVDVMQDPLSAELMKVRSLPTLILFVNGTEITRKIGYCGEKAINEMLSQHLDKL